MDGFVQIEGGAAKKWLNSNVFTQWRDPELSIVFPEAVLFLLYCTVTITGAMKNARKPAPIQGGADLKKKKRCLVRWTQAHPLPFVHNDDCHSFNAELGFVL
jgi:hypothetical protein